MEPIISPWLIYALSVADAIGNLTFVATGLGFFGFIASTMTRVSMLVDGDWDEKDDAGKIALTKRLARRFAWVFAVCLPLTTLLPSSKTLTAMIAAQYITRDNVAEAIKSGKALKDEVKRDVIEIIEAIRGQEKEQTK